MAYSCELLVMLFFVLSNSGVQVIHKFLLHHHEKLQTGQLIHQVVHPGPFLLALVTRNDPMERWEMGNKGDDRVVFLWFFFLGLA